MKKLFIIVTALFLITAGVCGAADRLTIVRGQDFAPYHFKDENNVETGFIVDLINRVAGQMGITVHYVQYPWSRCINMVKKGDADAMMNLFKTPERLQFMEFADNVIAYETNSFFAMADKGLTYDGDISSMTQLRIGTIRNYSYGEQFDRVHFPVNFELETEAQLLNALLNRRCDVIIANKLVINTMLTARGLAERVVPLFPDVSKDPLYIAFSKIKGHRQLAKKFSNQLKRFKTTPEYNRILAAYAIESW
jgi:polar amino acid transport system substrate-binding protein